jgi:hypothetical protein
MNLGRAGIEEWRCGSGSNRRIRVLQTLALPLGYRTILLDVVNSPRAAGMTGKSKYECLS